MKLIPVLRPLLALAAACTLASCAMEPFRTDGAGSGPSERMTFNVSLGTATKAVAPSAFDDGSKVDKLYAAAFDASGRLAAQKVADMKDAAGAVTLTLVKGAAYKVVFFAMKDGQYSCSFADNLATFSYKENPYLANDPANDAFYGILEVKSASATKEDVVLRRPFAQINILSKNKPDGQDGFKSSMSVTAPTTFNLIKGEATGAASTILFDEHPIDTEHLTSPSTAYPHWIGMSYVLVPADSKTVTINTFRESGMSAAIAPGQVQVQPNYRTNLVGELYGDVDFSFTVHTGSGFEEEEEDIPYDSQDSQITIAQEGTFTENEPYAFDASPSGAKLTLNLLVNGHTFSTVDQYATDGGQVTAESQNPDIATAAVEGNQVVITPVADGKAQIVVSTPAYTKAAYRAQTFSFWVEISGVAPEPETPVEAGSDTIVFADLGLENGVQYSDPFEEGDMSVVFEGRDNDGKYYTTGAGIRIYGGGSVTVSSELEIIKIEYTFPSSYCPKSGSFTVSSGEYDLSTHTWTGSSSEVTLTRATGSGHWRLQKVTVYYGADNTDAILEHTALGAYMPGHERSYTAGADQYLREYDGDALTFVLLNPDEDEQMVVSGYTKSLKAGDSTAISVQWKKGTSSVLNGSWDMTVVKKENGMVWLATRSGNGFIIKD